MNVSDDKKKKVVVINGSPRIKGYTMRMVRIFEEYLTGIDRSIEFEYVHLIRKNLKFCLGCCRCLTHGGHNCPIKDDADEILKTMHSADGLILAAPGYSHSISGLYKNFMDRFMYLDHLPEFIGVPAAVISTSGAEGLNKPPKYMKDFGVVWWGCNVKDVLGIGSSLFVASEKYAEKTRKKLNRAAVNFKKMLDRKSLPSPSFQEYMFFRFNKTEMEIGPTVNPYRAEYWNENGWMDADYYYQARINPFYKLTAAMIFPLMKLAYRMTMGKNAEEKIKKYLNCGNPSKDLENRAETI